MQELQFANSLVATSDAVERKECGINVHWRPLPGTRDLLRCSASGEGNLRSLTRTLQHIPQICARFVKLSNRGARECDVSFWPDGGRKFDGFRGHVTLRSGKERQSESFGQMTNDEFLSADLAVSRLPLVADPIGRHHARRCCETVTRSVMTTSGGRDRPLQCMLSLRGCEFAIGDRDPSGPMMHFSGGTPRSEPAS